jgi:hypothetical protein
MLKLHKYNSAETAEEHGRWPGDQVAADKCRKEKRQ